jgi:hypothetical protein
LWQYIRRGLCPFAHLTRIESSAGNGVPDVSVGMPKKHLWIELKNIVAWPKRNTTKIKLPLRPEQRLWIATRGKISGNVWVICRIDKSIFLLTWQEALLAYEGWTSAEWVENSRSYWPSKVDFGALHRELDNE